MDPSPDKPGPNVTLAQLLACSDEAFVHAAYRALLGREADPEGLGNYLEELRTGVAKEDVLASLVESREGRARAGFAPALRRELELARERGDAVRAPVAPTLEALLAHYDEAFIRCAYLVTLGREADAAGLSHYLALLRDGQSKLAILAELRGSPESARREAGVRAIGGDPAGAALAPLLEGDDAAFLERAHPWVTGRKPALSALARDAARLKSGVTRTDVLAGLAASEAAAATARVLQALDAALRRRRWMRVPVLGRWIAGALGVEGEGANERRLRRMENEVFVLGRALRPDVGVALPAVEAAEPVAEAAAAPAPSVLRPVRSVATLLSTLPTTVGANERQQERAKP